MKSPHRAVTAALPGCSLLIRSLLAPSRGKTPPALCWQRDLECPSVKEFWGCPPSHSHARGAARCCSSVPTRALHKGIRSPHGSARHQAVSQLRAVRCLRFSAQICGAGTAPPNCRAVYFSLVSEYPGENQYQGGLFCLQGTGSSGCSDTVHFLPTWI